MPDVEIRESEINGFGVFATRDFESHEVVLPLDDSRVVDDEHPLCPELGEYNYHWDYLADGKVVLQPSPECYINSSCDPNVFVKTIDEVRFVVARRAIKTGEEITYDYIIDCHGGIVWECGCKSPECRGTIVSSFFELPLKLQFDYIPLLNPWFINEHREKVQELERLRANLD